MTFDGDALGRIAAQILSGLSEGSASVGTNVGFVEVEIGIAHFAREDFVLRRFGSWRRSSRNSDARAGCRRATRTARGDRVRRGSGRSDGLLTFGRNGADVWRDGELRCVG